METDERFWVNVEWNVSELEGRLGLPAGFLALLSDDEPWTFVIKAHALLEAAISHAAVVTLGSDEVEQWISRHNLHGRTGLTTLLLRLDVIDKKECNFLEAFSDLRNKLLHRVENIDFEYTDFFDELDENERTHLLTRLAYAVAGSDAKAKIDVLRNDPQETLWVTVRLILTVIHLKIIEMEQNRESMSLKARIAELHLEISESRSELQTSQEGEGPD